MGSLAHEACTYGQSRGVAPLSCAYVAADASSRGRTSAWSGAIQSVITFHCVPSHCWNRTLPPLMIAAREGDRRDQALCPYLFERCRCEAEVFEPPLHLRARQGLVAEVAHGCADLLRREQAAQHARDPKLRADIPFRPRPLAAGVDILEDVLDERKV